MIEVALPDAVREFLAVPRRFATLATVNDDGTPHQVVVWYLLRDDHLVLNTRVGRRWPTNALRDPRISLTVEDGGVYYTLRGDVEPIDDPQRGQADIAEMAHRYLPAELAQRNIESLYRTHHRISFVFRPRRIHRDTE